MAVEGRKNTVIEVFIGIGTIISRVGHVVLDALMVKLNQESIFYFRLLKFNILLLQKIQLVQGESSLHVPTMLLVGVKVFCWCWCWCLKHHFQYNLHTRPNFNFEFAEAQLQQNFLANSHKFLVSCHSSLWLFQHQQEFLCCCWNNLDLMMLNFFVWYSFFFLFLESYK